MDYNRSNPDPERAKKTGRRRRIILWALGLIVLVLLAIIVSQQLWLWTVIQPDTASDTLALYALSTLNFVAFVVFSFIFVRNLLKLRRERRERQLGSKIKTRLLVYFIAISFLPITAMAVFSYLFLNRSLEKWFSPFPEGVVQEAREIRLESLTIHNQSLRETASVLAVVLGSQNDADRQQTMDRVVAKGHIVALEIIDSKGTITMQSKARLPTNEQLELEQLLDQARRTKAMTESLADGKAFDVLSVSLSGTQRLLLAPARLPNSLITDLIADSQSEYQKLVKRQRRVRWLGVSTLGLMTLMLFFVSSWVAIYLARGIATPIKALAEASDEIARGNLAHRVESVAEDELALLAHSFNEMTAQLEENRRRIEAGSAELREKNFALEERRNYIETVLESLTTGVISLDEDDRVTTINAAAARMLRLTSSTTAEAKLQALIGAEDHVVLDRLVRRARRTGQATEQTQLTGSGAEEPVPIPVALTATALRSNSSLQRRGVVIVLEDLSELLAAQRAAAWSEVARRMAHEIKNPLTPIQLSAERIAKSYRRLGLNGAPNGIENNGDESVDAARVGKVIAECTETITREVSGLKAMVDEFSRFARLPLARLEPADLNEVVRHAVALYQDRLDGVKIETDLDPHLPTARLDPEQLRRVFVNLIDNAFEALLNVHGERIITIKTIHDSSRNTLQAQVADTGLGIESSDFKRLFQPYFSTRGSGTGLGLAIVQRIVMEHRGRIRAEPNQPRGARFIVDLPVTTG